MRAFDKVKMRGRTADEMKEDTAKSLFDMDAEEMDDDYALIEN